ncbi:MAG: DUF393 domain-containing protein [Bacteroidia bacterium]
MKPIQTLHNLILKSAFPEIRSVEYEQRKQSIIRWILGFFVMLRFSEIVYAAQYLPVYEDLNLIGFGTIAIIFLFTIGLFLPVTTVLLMFAVTIFEQHYRCFTLGTNILSTYLFVSVLSGSGRYYSADALMLRSSFKLFNPVKALYRIAGNPDKNQLRIMYFLGFVSYGVVSLCALSYHLFDENWMNGLTPYLFFPAAYLSTYFQFFRDLQEAVPGLFHVMSVVAILGQSLFQFFMIPLMWTKYGKVFVIFWGFSFFTASLFLINLSYLPHVEVLSWLVYFTRVRKYEPYVLLYDDRCNFCKRSVSVLRFLNFNGLLEFVPISLSAELLKKHNLDETEVKVWMYGIRGNEILKGYDLYYKVVFRNPLLWLLVPFFIIGKYTGLGYRIYAAIARNRYKIFGTCELTYPKQKESNYEPVMAAAWLKGTTAILLCLYVTYLSFQLPIVGRQVRYYVGRVHLGFLLPPADFALVWGGFVTPIVFNAADIKLNERYFNLYRITDKGKELVPLIDEAGGRLDYFRDADYFYFCNHGSGLLYFSLILQYERGMIDQPVEEYHDPDNVGGGTIKNLIVFDKRYLSENEPDKLDSIEGYELIVYENECASSLDEDRFENQVVYRQTFEK